MSLEDNILHVLDIMRSEQSQFIQRSDARLDRMEANCDLMRASIAEHGKEIAIVKERQTLHAKRISGITRALGKEQETTQRMRVDLIERTATKRAVLKIGKAVWDTKVFWFPVLLATLVYLGLVTR